MVSIMLTREHHPRLGLVQLGRQTPKRGFDFGNKRFVLFGQLESRADVGKLSLEALGRLDVRQEPASTAESLLRSVLVVPKFWLGYDMLQLGEFPAFRVKVKETS